MSKSKTLILNTAASYTRSVLSTGLALFSSRWLLQALGQSDFGLFSLVGSLIVFVTFLNNIMAVSTARFFAFSIGKGKPGEVRQWFNAAVGVHLMLACGLVVIGLPAGEFAITHALSIPEGRTETVHWMFRILLGSSFMSMISVPFAGMLTAHQRIAELAAIGMVQSSATCILAYIAVHYSGDKLLFYTASLSGVVIMVQLLTILRAGIVFQECRLRLAEWLNWPRIREMGSFAVWYLFGGLGITLRDQGLAMLLNTQFGTRLNAAYGISTQVSMATNQLSVAMMGAFTPEITRSEGEGNRERMLMLAQRVNRLGAILVALLAIPLLLEIDYVLRLWLQTVPAHTAILCQLTLTMFMIDRLTGGYMLAISACGRIAAYQATMGISLLLTLPIAWLLLKSGLAPWCVGIASVTTMILCCLGRLVWARSLLNARIVVWLTHALVPSIGVCAASALAGFLVRSITDASFARLALVCFATMVTALSATWLLVLDVTERVFIVNTLRRMTGLKLGQDA